MSPWFWIMCIVAIICVTILIGMALVLWLAND